MQCYLQKLKKIRASLIQSMYFYMVIVEAIQCRIVLFPTPTVITIYIITLQKKTIFPVPRLERSKLSL